MPCAPHWLGLVVVWLAFTPEESRPANPRGEQLPPGVEPLPPELVQVLHKCRAAAQVLRDLSAWLRKDEAEQAWSVAANGAGFPKLKSSTPPTDCFAKWVSTCLMVSAWLSPGRLAIAARLRQGGAKQPPATTAIS